MKMLLLTVGVLFTSMIANATPMPIRVECNGQNFTLKAGADSKWTKDPYYYPQKDLLTVVSGGKQYTLLVQGPDYDSTVGVLHATGIAIDNSDAFFEFFMNTKSAKGNGSLKIDGLHAKVIVNCSNVTAPKK